MQRAEIEEMRQRDANLTALQAIGPRKKPKLESEVAGTSTVRFFLIHVWKIRFHISSFKPNFFILLDHNRAGYAQQKRHTTEASNKARQSA